MCVNRTRTRETKRYNKKLVVMGTEVIFCFKESRFNLYIYITDITLKREEKFLLKLRLNLNYFKKKLSGFFL